MLWRTHQGIELIANYPVRGVLSQCRTQQTLVKEQTLLHLEASSEIWFTI